MNQSPSVEQIVCMKFDSFIKTCLRNELRNIEKYEKRLRSRELMISDFSLIEGKSDIAEIVIPDFIVKGLEISIKDPDLLEALQKLTARERELILLIHFTGFKPKDISEQMNVVERTIYNQHKKILIKLKNYMEEAND
ncbi:MAG: sigma-70 family RNA polymerase sigma factor [Firmicutes bacterium]|nr:sigma-70 family RNA polymerase sigma factor [Bacillota bacterium]